MKPITAPPNAFIPDTPVSDKQPDVQQLVKANYNARLVVVEHIYHGRKDGTTYQLSPSYQRFLETNEQTYGPRELEATQNWQAIDCGWMKKASLIVIQNITDSKGMSKEDREQTTLEVCLAEATQSAIVWLIPPGESMRGLPSKLQCLSIRSRSAGMIPYTITIIPE